MSIHKDLRIAFADFATQRENNQLTIQESLGSNYSQKLRTVTKCNVHVSDSRIQTDARSQTPESNCLRDDVSGQLFNGFKSQHSL